MRRYFCSRTSEWRFSPCVHALCCERGYRKISMSEVLAHAKRLDEQMDEQIKRIDEIIRSKGRISG